VACWLVSARWASWDDVIEIDTLERVLTEKGGIAEWMDHGHVD
jgi:hypothetical protein